MKPSLLLLAPALMSPVLACGDDEGASASFSDLGNWQEVGTADTWLPPDVTPGDVAPPDTTPADTAPPPPPPETETDFDLRTPEAGATFLYIPSAALDALVVVDARTLDVHLVEVGLVPTTVRALPGDLGAVVLNEGSSELSIVRPRPTSAGAPPDPPFAVESIDVTPGANQLVLSPDGTFAFAFFAPTSLAGRVGSLQDVTAVRLAAPDGTPLPPTAYALAVGFRPERILFADDARLALVVCEDGISGVRLADLGGDTFLPPVPTSPDPFLAPHDREIVPTPDGRHALVRDLDHMALAWVDLQSGTLGQLPLPDYPSDLELTADGLTALVPLRTSQRVALVTVPDAFSWTAPAPDPALPPEDQTTPTNPFVRYADAGAPFGSTVLTADQRHALLYTTTPGVTAIGMLDLATAQAVIKPTLKELAAVVPSPDGTMAALLHRRASGTGELANRDAWSLLDLATGYAKLVVTAQPVTDVTFTRDARELFALLPDPLGTTHEVQRVDTRTFASTTYRVPERPVYVGALPTLSKVAIALDDPTGWITFVDTDTDALTQLNSFELNGFIE